MNDAFLHGELCEEFCMSQLKGFKDKRKSQYVCKLKKALCGLTQAQKAWYSKLSSTLKDWGFKNSKSNTSLFFLQKNADIILLLVYVDDILLTVNNNKIIEDIIQKLDKSFSLKDLGSLKYFLVEVERNAEGMHLSQGKYIMDLLKRTGMENCKSLPTPMSTSIKFKKEGGKTFSDDTLYRSVIEGLQYATLTRPEIAYVVNTLSHYLEVPKQSH